MTGTEPAISTNKRPKLNQSTFETTLQSTSDQAQESTIPTLTLGSRLQSEGDQEQTLGLKKWSRLLTWGNVFFDALATN